MVTGRGVIIVSRPLDSRTLPACSAGPKEQSSRVSKPHFDIALALVARNGRWLVARRHANVHLGGMWEFPGGKMEPGESPADAAMRELLEECDVRADYECLLDPVFCEYDIRTVMLHPVICRWRSGEAKPLGSAECRWVTLDELSTLAMPPVNATIVDGLRRGAADHAPRPPPENPAK